MFPRIAWRPLYEEDSQGGSSPPTPTPQAKADRVAELVQHMDITKLAVKVTELEGDNHRLREKKRDLEATITDLKGKQVPDGAVVLTGDEAARWQAYQALGTPDELTKVREQRDADAQELAKLRTKEAVRTAAAVYDWKDDVLYDLLAPRGLVPVVKEETQGEQVVKQAFVKDGDQDVPLDTFVARFLPALQREASQQQTQTQRQGARVIEQHHGGSGQPRDIVDGFATEAQRARDSRPNPFVKQPAT